jgi:hypothetical protein
VVKKEWSFIEVIVELSMLFNINLEGEEIC